MIVQLTNVLALPIATFPAAFSVGEELLALFLHAQGSFLLDRLAFAAHYPASALTGLLVNAAIIVWFGQRRSRSSVLMRADPALPAP